MKNYIDIAGTPLADYMAGFGSTLLCINAEEAARLTREGIRRALRDAGWWDVLAYLEELDKADEADDEESLG
jgi:hypothetical protein